MAHRTEMDGHPVASLDDLEWSDAYIFGTPTRSGNVAAQLKQFMDTTGTLWGAGKLADKAVAGFTSSQNAHGGPPRRRAGGADRGPAGRLVFAV